MIHVLRENFIIKIYRRTYGLLKAHPVKTQMIFGEGLKNFRVIERF